MSPSDLRRMQRRATERLVRDRQGAWAEGSCPNKVARITTDLDAAFEAKRKEGSGRHVPVPNNSVDIEMRTDGNGDSLVRRKSQVAARNDLALQIRKATRSTEIRHRITGGSED